MIKATTYLRESSVITFAMGQGYHQEHQHPSAAGLWSCPTLPLRTTKQGPLQLILAFLLFLAATKGAASFLVLSPQEFSRKQFSRLPPSLSPSPREGKVPSPSSRSINSRHIVFLSAKNQNKGASPPQPREREKITDPLQLVLLYMTPWKNPNSIFVYMLLVVYVLGKLNENRHP